VGVPEAVETVSAVLPEPPVIVAGLKENVAPAGKPLAVRLTLPVKPFNGMIVIPYPTLPPGVLLA
jgi:hypothetical protein